jgi:hypothetical protein
MPKNKMLLTFIMKRYTLLLIKVMKDNVELPEVEENYVGIFCPKIKERD